jgi:hypothetical protein
MDTYFVSRSSEIRLGYWCCEGLVNRWSTTHTPTLFERSYAKVFDDHQDMETRRRLAAIGFAVSGIDQALTNGS